MACVVNRYRRRRQVAAKPSRPHPHFMSRVSVFKKGANSVSHSEACDLRAENTSTPRDDSMTYSAPVLSLPPGRLSGTQADRSANPHNPTNSSPIRKAVFARPPPVIRKSRIATQTSRAQPLMKPRHPGGPAQPVPVPDAAGCRPVDPKPAAPREVSSSAETTTRAALATGAITSCATRVP